MKVLLTGPFGKIGYRVIEALLAKQHEVTCFDLDTAANRQTASDFGKRIQLIWGDITDGDAVIRAVNQAEVVIHNAALIPPATDRNLARSEKINVGGTQTIVSAIDAMDKKPLLIFPSSISVHGLQNIDSPEMLTVDAPLKGEDHYAQHKIRCETLIENSDIPWVILRIGACMEGSTRLSMQDSMELIPVMLSIHPKVRVEYIHTRDAATAIVNAIDNPAALRKKFFLGGGTNCQAHWREFNNMAMKAIGIRELSETAFGTQSYYTHWMNTEESQNVLNFQRHSLQDYQDELDRSYRWLRLFTKPFGSIAKWGIQKYAANASSGK
jgi:nucleoside-diphosphate-sugar epimerase